jgi:hypothetical protein
MKEERNRETGADEKRKQVKKERAGEMKKKKRKQNKKWEGRKETCTAIAPSGTGNSVNLSGSHCAMCMVGRRRDEERGGERGECEHVRGKERNKPGRRVRKDRKRGKQTGKKETNRGMQSK